jgi:hypothetical protein
MQATKRFISQHGLALLGYLFLAYFSYLMVLITLQYIPIALDVAFLRIKQDVIGYRHYQIAFFTHVYASIWVLMAGSLQFSASLRRRYPAWHRGLGRLYVGTILCAAGPSGLVMAYYAHGGVWAQVSFGILSVLWLVFTYEAFRKARKRNWVLHQHFMWRSFALTLSAISLRLFKWAMVHTLALPPVDTYLIVAWAGWVVNLLVVEVYIRSNL